MAWLKNDPLLSSHNARVCNFTLLYCLLSVFSTVEIIKYFCARSSLMNSTEDGSSFHGNASECASVTKERGTFS